MSSHFRMLITLFLVWIPYTLSKNAQTPLQTYDFIVNYSKTTGVWDEDWCVGGRQREGSRIGQGERLGVLKLGWTSGIEARGPDFYIPVSIWVIIATLGINLVKNSYLYWAIHRRSGKFILPLAELLPAQGINPSFLKEHLGNASTASTVCGS